MNNETPTWKNTFNSHLSPTRWGFIDAAFQAAKAAEYPYICWNGRVYLVNEGNWSTSPDDTSLCFEWELK